MTTRCQEPYEKGSRLCAVCRLSPVIDGLKRCSRLVARSPAMQTLLQRAASVAATDASVLVSGETGTGKEVLARALHANSTRASRPFVAVNVAAIPAELIESELFGHVKGAFTGALTHHTGLMQAAHGGTLFLDEIGEMPQPMQAKLLRALHDGEVRKVGDSRMESVDVRVICATHRNLADHVASGAFRQDLYYRLKVFAFHVPALRDRPEDLQPLVEMFLEMEGAAGARFTDEAWKLLRGWPWPGNVRELGNVIKHGAVLARVESSAHVQLRSGPRALRIAREHLPDELGLQARALSNGNVLRTLAEVESSHIERVLQACGGNQVAAARILGVGRTTLWRKMKLGAEN
ncbi:MAG: sigma-54-dependent Fis family transcriptional regulator [Deltaproteobacteria bacterium]|nr:sigma-54-dependent Fis family transcriptional regulator [Deltaproteobacteria bacterium]